MKNIIQDFDDKVLDFFTKQNIFLSPEVTICAGVSGGADSVSLLISLCHLSKIKKNRLKIISVNHKIRADEETDSDADFVKNLCENLKKEYKSLDYKIVELKKGAVFEAQKERNNGLEEAARFLRYNEFYKFAKENDSSIFCIAHNQNDQVETLLMRFLQGSKTGSSGILEKRDIFYRPLLNISRKEIELYLKEQNIFWCTDKTNLCTDYFRNKIRLNAIPFLDENFSGWQKAVLSGAKKVSSDEDFINQFVKDFKICKKTVQNQIEVNFSLTDFLNLHFSVASRVLFKVLDSFFSSKRISFKFVEELYKIILNYSQKQKNENLNRYNISIYGLQIEFSDSTVCIKNQVKIATDSRFFAIIEDEGVFNFPFGLVKVVKNGFEFDATFVFENETLDLHFSGPFCVRSFEVGDKVKTAGGLYKNLSDVFSDWKVLSPHKNQIPVLQDFSNCDFEIKAVLAQFLGYKNWILK